ncbi:MAG: lysylphosphatidylglycerol synthase transmembrane domain-containing protein [Thermoprotei archaeon]|nr:lysylphosphatidylglycerol synthase transmembrane domain-containing protein [TACK group archaeon]
MKYSTVRWALALSFGLVMIFMLLILTRETDVLSVIDRTDPKLLLGGAALEVFGLFLYALSWHVLLRSSGMRVRLTKSIQITWASLFLLYVTPAGVLMDVSRAILMGKEGKDTPASTASVIMQRVIYAFAYALLTTSSIFMIYFSDRARFHLIYPFMIFVALTVAAGFLILIAASHRGLVRWLSRHLLSFYYRVIKKAVFPEEDVTRSVESSVQGFSAAISDMARSPKGALLSLAIILARLSVAAGISYGVFISLNYYGINFWEITLVMLVGEFVTSVPIGIPGMLGFVEAAMTLSYAALGVPLAVALAATLLIRLILYWWDVVVTGITATVYSGGIRSVLSASEQGS